MENKEHIGYEELLIRYLQDTADTQALQQLLEIVRMSEDKKHELAQLKSIYDSLSIHVEARKYPIEAGWDRIWRKIDSGQPKTFWRKNMIRLWTYAAIFLLVLALAGQSFYYQSKNQPVKTEDSYTRFVVEKGQGKSTLFLPDGTKVLLSAGTTIQYPTQFDQKERIVMLEGEGYFEGAEIKQKPFIVKMKGYDVKVLGTVFNVRAYPEMAYSMTSLISGKVFLTSYDTNGVVRSEQILHPDETVRIDKQTGAITNFRNDDAFRLDWRKGLYKFKDKSLIEVTTELEHLYNVKIQIENEQLAQSVYTGSFVLENTIEDVLKPLGQYNKFKFKKDSCVIHIYSSK